MRLRRVGLVLGCALLALTAGCEQTDVVVADVARVVVDPAALSVPAGGTARLTATVLASGDEPLPGRSVAWRSDDSAVATVDGAGMVTGLAPGSAIITAVAEGSEASAVVQVTEGPAVAVAPASVAFTAVAQGASPGDRTVSITNGGTGTLTGLTATVTYAAGAPDGWLTAALARSAAPAAVVLSADPGGLAPGSYAAELVVASAEAGSSARVPVVLSVLEPAPAIGLGATAVAFAAAVNAPDPAPRTVPVTNAGGGTLSGLAAEVAYAGGAATGWLTAALGAPTAPTELTLRVAAAGLEPGPHVATVRITSPGATNSPQDLTVTFAVGDPRPILALSPTALALEAVEDGGDPPRRPVAVTNAGGGTLSGLTVSVTYPGGAPAGWVTTELGGTTAPATLLVGAHVAGLAAGTYTATVEVSGAGTLNGPQQLPVTLVVRENPPVVAVSPGSAAFAASMVGPDPPPDTLSVTNAGGGTLDGLTVVGVAYGAGEPSAWLTATLTGATAPAELVLAASAAGLAAGSYGATVRVGSAAAANGGVDVPVTLVVATSVPAAPTALTATAPAPDLVALTWTDNSDDETAFEVERASDVSPAWSPAATLPAGTTTWADGTVAPATGYRYRVRACRDGACSSWTAEAAVTTPALPPPAAPTGLTATALDTSRVELVWADNSGDETRFEVERASGASPAWAPVAALPAGTTTWVDGTVAPATSYRYRVRACRDGACSSWTAEATVTTPVAALAAPTNVSAVPASGPSHILVSWNPVTWGPDRYELQWRRVGAASWSAATTGAGESSLNVKDLERGTTYEFRVRACGAPGCSPWSATITATSS